MSADFGILPPEERRIYAEEQLLQELLGHTVFLQPPVAANPPAATYFPAEGGVSGRATFGGPTLSSGSEGAYVGFGFNASENPLPSSTLPGVLPSLPLDSPSASTPPEVYGGATAWWDPAALPNVSFSPSPAPGSSAPVDLSLLNAGAALSSAHPGFYTHRAQHEGLKKSSVAGLRAAPFLPNHGLLAAGGNAFGSKFGEEAVAGHDFGFQYPLPSGQSIHHLRSLQLRSLHLRSLPNPSVPSPAFMPPAAHVQNAPPTQEFVQGSSSGASPIGWLPAASHLAASPPLQFAFGNVATHMSSPSLPNPPSAFINGGSASTSNAYGGTRMFSPDGQIVHRDGELVGPSASPSILGKRKAESTYLSSSKAKAAKLSADSRRSQQEPTKADKENGPAASASEFKAEWKFTHNIDWSRPPTWAGNPIPEMGPKEVFSYLGRTYKFGWDKILRCEYDNCARVFDNPGALKSHVMGRDHMDLRRECLRCGWSVREDNFSARHNTLAKCDKYVKRKERKRGKR